MKWELNSPTVRFLQKRKNPADMKDAAEQNYSLPIV